VYSATKHFVEGFSQGLRREGLRDGVKEGDSDLEDLTE
jgi:short-subunit dehydrogenase